MIITMNNNRNSNNNNNNNKLTITIIIIIIIILYNRQTTTVRDLLPTESRGAAAYTNSLVHDFDGNHFIAEWK